MDYEENNSSRRFNNQPYEVAIGSFQNVHCKHLLIKFNNQYRIINKYLYYKKQTAINITQSEEILYIAYTLRSSLCERKQ